MLFIENKSFFKNSFPVMIVQRSDVLITTNKVYKVLNFSHLYNEIMNNILKYFDKSWKKRDRSGESNSRRGKEKVREGSSKSNNLNDTIDDEVFQQTNSTSDISEILVSLRKLEAKVAELICNEIKSMQIKGDKQLAELTESVQHVRQIRWFRKR